MYSNAMMNMPADKRGALLRTGPRVATQDNAPMAESIRFRCRDLGDEAMTLTDLWSTAREFLLGRLHDDPLNGAAKMILTLNKSKLKVKACVETLVEYLNNIMDNPDNEKFLRIRENNVIFQERICSVYGAREFLTGVGFVKKRLPYKLGNASFLVLDSEKAFWDMKTMEKAKEALLKATSLAFDIERDVQVFSSAKYAPKVHIPDEFYDITKQEQQRREDIVDLYSLRTRTMRYREDSREVRRYRYTLVRVRMPDGVLVQAVFRASETTRDLYDFVREHITTDWLPFHLTAATGIKVEEGTTPLDKQGLAPASLVYFTWDQDMLDEVSKRHKQTITKNVLKEETLALITEVPVDKVEEESLHAIQTKAHSDQKWKLFKENCLHVLCYLRDLVFALFVLFIVVHFKINLFDLHFILIFSISLYILNITGIAFGGYVTKVFLKHRKSLFFCLSVGFMVYKYNMNIFNMYTLIILMFALYILNL